LFFIGNEKFNSTRDYYSDVMQRFFRRNPPIPTNMYLHGEIEDSEELKIQVAEHCHFPSIINSLANDESDRVRRAAHCTEFWRLVGRFQDILGFDKRERRAFARTEGHPNILVLLMFEDDPEVITEVLHNPTVSLNILILFQRLLKDRGTGRKDEQLQMIARGIIADRREQIIKISEINKASEEIGQIENIKTILGYVTEKDPTIFKAIENLLNAQHAEIIRKFVNLALDEKNFEHILAHFIALSALITFIGKRDDLKRIPLSALRIEQPGRLKGPYHSIADFFINLLIKKRLGVVKHSIGDLTDFQNVILLTHCHIESDSSIRQLAREIMPLQDILGLVNDISTPRKVFTEVLSILENHPDETVVEQVHDTHMQESQRMRDSLKELELTVQAYFDIIFQSLGYNKINDFLDVVRSIDTTENQLLRFERMITDELGANREILRDLLSRIKSILNKKASGIYFDTGPNVSRELESIFAIIGDIFELKDMGIQSLRPGTPQDIESEVRARARVIWQSAISIYLGRIKDLSEMMRKKILRIAASYADQSNLENEIRETTEALEKSYKNKIQCKLVHPCRVCGKRGCASERFLQETHFFIKEYLDNFVDL